MVSDIMLVGWRVTVIMMVIHSLLDYNYLFIFSSNNEGQTGRHLAASDATEVGAKMVYILHSVGAARCPFLMASCHPGCSPDGSDNGIPPPPPSGPAQRAVSSILQVPLILVCSLKLR